MIVSSRVEPRRFGQAWNQEALLSTCTARGLNVYSPAALASTATRKHTTDAAAVAPLHWKGAAVSAVSIFLSTICCALTGCPRLNNDVFCLWMDVRETERERRRTNGGHVWACVCLLCFLERGDAFTGGAVRVRVSRERR